MLRESILSGVACLADVHGNTAAASRAAHLERGSPDNPDLPTCRRRKMPETFAAGENRRRSPALKSGWRESNPRDQLGRLGLYH